MAKRKAEMILDLVDRVTRPARRVMQMMTRMGQAARSSNSLGGKATRAYASAQTALQNRIRRTNQLIAVQTEKLRASGAVMRNGALGIAGGAVLGVAALSGLAASGTAAGLALLGPAREFERFQSILTTTEGSAEAAKEAMAWVEGFAVKTPYELDQVMDAFVQLRSYGLDPTNGMLETLGNTSAAMGKPLMQSVEAIADAVNGENERLKEFGIKASKAKGMITYQYTDADGVTRFAKAAANGKAAIEATLLDIMSKYDGAMNNLSLTFDGMISNVMDLWSKFQRMIMGSGVFDWMKGKLQLLLDTLSDMEASGALNELAAQIGENIIWSLELLWSFGLRIQDVWQSVFPYLEQAAGMMGGWENLLMSLIAIPFRGVILAAVLGLAQLAGGAVMASRALVAMSGSGAVAGLMRLASGFLGLLNPINLVKGALVALRIALVASGIGAIVLALAAAGTLIYNNWAGLGAFFTAFGQAFMAALGPARPLVEGVVSALSSVWDAFSALFGPLDVSAEQWASWGETAGATVGRVVAAILDFPSTVMAGLSAAWAAVSGWFTAMWAGLSSAAQSAWDGLKFLLLNYTPAGLVFNHWGGLREWAASLWPDLGALATTAWESLKSVLMNYTPHGLIYQNWQGITAWFTSMWPDLGAIAKGAWDLLKTTLANYTPAGLIYTHWSGITDWFSELWAKLPSIDWDAMINLAGIKEAWNAVYTWFSDAAAGLWDLLPEMPEWNFNLWGDDEVQKPETLLAAAKAAEELETQFPALQAAGQTTLTEVQAVLLGISTAMAAVDLTADGARIASSIATGLISQIDAIRDAAAQMAQAIEAGLPGSAKVSVALAGQAASGSGANVQARARGGSYGPGWLLTGENGPELKYENRRGYVAHNLALRRMSQTARAAAVSAAMASPAVAEDVAPSGQSYVTAKSAASAPVSASLTLNVQGNVDRDVMPDLKAQLEKAKRELLEELDRRQRAKRRKEH